MDNEAIKEVNAILKWINVADDVKDFYLKVGEVEISLSRNENSAIFANGKVAKADAPAPVQAVPATAAVSAVAQPVAQTPAVSVEVDVPPAENEVVIKAPMVGTFYAALKPGAPAFVKVGDTVQAGQTLLIIEAMKTMNPIPAPRGGKVAEILVEDAQPVEFGEPLVVIE